MKTGKIEARDGAQRPIQLLDTSTVLYAGKLFGNRRQTELDSLET